MSVIVSKRKISTMQFYKVARDLRKDTTKMLEAMFCDESKFSYSRGHWISLSGDARKADLLYNKIYGETI